MVGFGCFAVLKWGVVVYTARNERLVRLLKKMALKNGPDEMVCFMQETCQGDLNQQQQLKQEQREVIMMMVHLHMVVENHHCIIISSLHRLDSENKGIKERKKQKKMRI